MVCDSEGMASRGMMRRVLLEEDVSNEGVTRRFRPIDDGRAGVRGATGDMATTSRPARDRDVAVDDAMLEAIERMECYFGGGSGMYALGESLNDVDGWRCWCLDLGRREEKTRLSREFMAREASRLTTVTLGHHAEHLLEKLSVAEYSHFGNINHFGNISRLGNISRFGNIEYSLRQQPHTQKFLGN
jgi:hypothetical protein